MTTVYGVRLTETGKEPFVIRFTKLEAAQRSLTEYDKWSSILTAELVQSTTGPWVPVAEETKQ